MLSSLKSAPLPGSPPRERGTPREWVRGRALESTILQVSGRGAHANGPSLDTKHMNNARLVIYRLDCQDNTFEVRTK